MPPQNQHPENGAAVEAPETVELTSRRPQAQSRVSRRALLRGGAVVGTVAVAAAAGAGSALAVTKGSTTALKPVGKPTVVAPMAPTAMEGPLVVYINDTTTGEVDVFAGTGQTRMRNPALVTQLLNSLK